MKEKFLVVEPKFALLRLARLEAPLTIRAPWRRLDELVWLLLGAKSEGISLRLPKWLNRLVGSAKSSYGAVRSHGDAVQRFGEFDIYASQILYSTQ